MKIYYINGWSSADFKRTILAEDYHNCFLCHSKDNLKYILFFMITILCLQGILAMIALCKLSIVIFMLTRLKFLIPEKN